MRIVPQGLHPAIKGRSQKTTAAPAPYSPHAGLSAPAVDVAVASLGTTARSRAFPLWTDPETGEIKPAEKTYDPHQAGAERLALQDIVAKLLPNSRTAKCQRVPTGQHGSAGSIELRKCVSSGTSFFVGLQTCASVWACPICAAKISERRRVEVLAAMESHKVGGGVHSLLTLTHRHSRHDVLVDTLARQATALEIFNRDGSVKTVFKAMGIVGSIRALEVTSSHRSEKNNGWHAHVHSLQFGGVGDDLKPRTAEQMAAWESILYRRWASACKRACLGAPDREHGVRLDSGDHAGKYVAKMGLEQPKRWDFSHEITKANLKKSRTGESPFDLLRAIDADATDRQAGRLFVEYVEAFAGRRQLHWSKGLKARFNLGDVTDVEATDAEVEAQVVEKSELVAVIQRDQWRDVLAVQGRATLKRLALYGPEPVARYLATIKGRGKPYQAPPQAPQAAAAPPPH